MMMFCFFFFKQKTAYEMRISDWSSDVCSSDLVLDDPALPGVVTVISEQASTMATNELGEEVPVWRVVVSRMHHGNVRVSVFDRAFVRGADYAILARCAKTFLGLIGHGAKLARGTGSKLPEKSISNFPAATKGMKCGRDV